MDYVGAYLKYIETEKRYSSHTLAAYKKDLSQFSEYIFQQYSIKHNKLSLVSQEHLRSWLVSLMEKGMAPSSVNRKLSAIKSLSKYLLKKDILKWDASLLLTGPKKQRALPVFVPQDEMHKLFDHLSKDETTDKRDVLILEILFTTGIRLSELLGIKVEDIDLNLMQVKVLGKRNKERIIPISNHLKKIISEYISEYNINLGLLIKTDSGKPAYPKLVYRVVYKYLNLFTSSQKKSPHVLRHSFATAMTNNGAPLLAIKEVLGHESLAATQIYTHNSIEKLKKVYKQAHPRG